MFLGGTLICCPARRRTRPFYLLRDDYLVALMRPLLDTVCGLYRVTAVCPSMTTSGVGRRDSYIIGTPDLVPPPPPSNTGLMDNGDLGQVTSVRTGLFYTSAEIAAGPLGRVELPVTLSRDLLVWCRRARL